MYSLNDWVTKGADVHNLYLNEDNCEKFWLWSGPYFGSLERKNFILQKALYGLNYAGSSFQFIISRNFYEMGFTLCVADPDVWMRPDVKPEGTEYYEYTMTYIDGIIAVSMDAVGIL